MDGDSYVVISDSKIGSEDQSASYLDSISAYGRAGIPDTKVFLDETLDAEFRKNGYVITQVLSSEEVAKLLAIHAEANPDQQVEFDATIFNPDPEYRARVRIAIEEIVKPRVLPLLNSYKQIVSNFINKRGRTTGAKVWMHQDYTFVDQLRHTGVHIWLPLVDVDEHNGCMSMYPGTHSFVNHIAAQPLHNRESFPGPYDGVRPVLEKGCAVSCPMKAGYGLFFNERLLHSSGDNHSPDQRVVITCAYIPESEPMLLYCPSPAQPGVLDVVEVTDITQLHLLHNSPIPFPYPDNLKKASEVRYTPEKLSIEQIKPLLRPDYVYVEGDELSTEASATWLDNAKAKDIESVSVASISGDRPGADKEPVDLTCNPTVGKTKPGWFQRLVGRAR